MKNVLLLLLALIVVPAWAADATPAPSSSAPSAQAEQTAPKQMAKHKTKKHKAKKSASTETNQSATPVGCAVGCVQTICSGVAGCFKKGCIAC